MEAPKPSNEADRLKALREYDVLDTRPEQCFDDFTQIAAYIAQTPIALISLVDQDRQWFKSKIGVEAAETAREISFCTHAIKDSKPLVIQDALLDDRFSNSPLVTGDPNIRFYAGAPLITPDGHGIGALCVCDRTPRELTEEQIAALQALSRQLMTLLELRKATKTIRTLSGLIPICAYCRKIRNDEGFWNSLEEYLTKYTDTKLSHGICPSCYEELKDKPDES